jgi:hypothetical protein
MRDAQIAFGSIYAAAELSQTNFGTGRRVFSSSSSPEMPVRQTGVPNERSLLVGVEGPPAAQAPPEAAFARAPPEALLQK